MPTPALLSPAQAAQRAKVSRRTIMRAIEAQELQAFRDNRNRWNIGQQDLDKWADAQSAPSEQRPEDAQAPAQDAHPPAQDETALELAAARATITQLEARLEDRAALVRAAEERAKAAELDRDRWRDMAERLAERPAEPPPSPPPQEAPPPPERRRWWPWGRA